MLELNALETSNNVNDSVKAESVVPNFSSKRKPGRPKGSSNLHSKHPSSIAWRLKRAGIDWIEDLALALKDNNIERINVWMKMLPYLVITQGHRHVKRGKGRVSKAAVEALEELEGR